MRRRDRAHLAGVHVLLHAGRAVPHEGRQSDELVRETSLAVLPVRLSDRFRVDDRGSADRIEAKKGKRSIETRSFGGFGT